MSALPALLDELVAAAAALPSVHSLVLPLAPNGDGASLGPVPPGDGAVADARSQLAAVIEAATERPRLLAARFEPFAELAAVSIAEYVEATRARTLGPDGYAAEAERWRALEIAATAAAPADVHCGLLLVHTAGLKAALAAKAEQLIAGVSALLTEEVNRIALVVSRDYGGIHARLQASSANAEEAMAMRDYLSSCRDQLEANEATLAAELQPRVELLEELWVALPDDVFAAMRAARGWPARLECVVQAATARQEAEKARFAEELRADREALEADLEAWAAEVRTLQALGDVTEVEKHASSAAELREKLDDGATRAALFQSREELFGWDRTEYPQLAELTEALEPYLALWTTAVNFQRAYPTWMEGPLLELDAERVERDVADWGRSLYKLGRSLAGGAAGPLRVIEHVQRRLADFKGHIPLMQVRTRPALADLPWRCRCPPARPLCCSHMAMNRTASHPLPLACAGRAHYTRLHHPSPSPTSSLTPGLDAHRHA